jgi:hypothetical protein
MFKGMMDDFHGSQGRQLLEHIDQPFERYIVDHGDILWIDDGMIYSHCKFCISSLHQWIEQVCSGTYSPCDNSTSYLAIL